MIIKKENLTALELGKFEKLLDKPYYWTVNGSPVTIKTIRELLGSDEFISKDISQVEHKSGPKTEFMFKCKSGGYLTVPKIVYKAIEFNTVNIGGLNISNVNSRSICQIIVDDLNRTVNDARETDQTQDLREYLYTVNLQELKKQGVYIKYGIHSQDLPPTVADFGFLVMQALLNDFDFRVCI